MYIHQVRDERDWRGARAVRQQVFIEEQRCPPEEEWDEYDDSSRHFVGRLDGEVVATARWREYDHEGAPAAKLERFAVLPEYRGAGYGRILVRAVMEDARNAGFGTMLLHAQAHLEAFYASLGFTTISGRFMEAGISHVAMINRGG